MARSSVKCQFMRNAYARKVTLEKGKVSLFKKMSELTTLYGVDACLVMYENEDSPALVWPSESEARRVIEKFQKTTTLGTNTTQDHDVGKMTRQVENDKEKSSKKLVKMLFDENAFGEANQEELEELRCALEGLMCALKNEIKLI